MKKVKFKNHFVVMFTILMIIQMVALGLYANINNVYAAKGNEEKIGIPSDLTTTTTHNQFAVSWSPVNQAESYDISMNDEVRSKIIDTQFLFENLQPSTDYTIKVRAITKKGVGQWSEPITTKTQELTEIPLNIPKNITTSAGMDYITISWDGVDFATKYDIEINGEASISTEACTYTTNALSDDTEYHIRVRAANETRNSEWSDTITVKTELKPDPHIGNGNGLIGEYYDIKNLKDLLMTRRDSQIAFDWGMESPVSGKHVDKFSVHWSGKVKAKYSGIHTIYTATDDAVRLWINGQQIINE